MAVCNLIGSLESSPQHEMTDTPARTKGTARTRPSVGETVAANDAVFRKLGRYSLAMIMLPLLTYFGLHNHVFSSKLRGLPHGGADCTTLVCTFFVTGD